MNSGAVCFWCQYRHTYTLTNSEKRVPFRTSQATIASKNDPFNVANTTPRWTLQNNKPWTDLEQWGDTVLPSYFDSSAVQDTQEHGCVRKRSKTTKTCRIVFVKERILTKASQHYLNAKCTLSIHTHLICNTLFAPQRKHLHNKTDYFELI